MKKFTILFCCMLFIIGISFAADTYCGDEICNIDESCKNCIWDCGVCEPLEDNESSGGGYIGTPPQKKTVTIFNSQEYLPYQIDSSAYTKSGENTTLIRLKVNNPYQLSTEAFRLQLDAGSNWFKPKEFEYSLDPDGFAAGKWPYWDIPPIGPGESIEFAFIVNGVIGTPNSINAKASPILRWENVCNYPLQEESSINASELNISRYLFSFNRTSDINIFYEMHKNNETFTLVQSGLEVGVFKLNESNVSIVSDKNTISEIVDEYINANSQMTKINTSKPFELIEYSKQAKSVAQGECYRITGMDRYNCTDRLSCFYSCFSIQVCSYLANGWDFIDTVFDYNKSIDAADKKLEDAISSTSTFKTNPTYNAASIALADIRELNRAQTKVMNHPLFTEYNFCPPADYAVPQQMEARRILMDYMDENCLYGEQEELINASLDLAKQINEFGGNITVGNISETPEINITINDSNITDMPATNQTIEKAECCAFGICSIAGIETIAGICWEYWIMIIVILIIIIAEILRRNEKKKND